MHGICKLRTVSTCMHNVYKLCTVSMRMHGVYRLHNGFNICNVYTYTTLLLYTWCLYTCIHIYMHKCVYVCTHTLRKYVYVCTFRIHVYVYTRVHIHIKRFGCVA